MQQIKQSIVVLLLLGVVVCVIAANPPWPPPPMVPETTDDIPVLERPGSAAVQPVQVQVQPGLHFQQPSMPLQQPALPLQRPAMPLQQPALPLQRPAMPLQQPALPLQRPAMPLQRPAVPLQQPAFPLQQPAKPNVPQAPKGALNGARQSVPPIIGPYETTSYEGPYQTSKRPAAATPYTLVAYPQSTPGLVDDGAPPLPSAPPPKTPPPPLAPSAVQPNPPAPVMVGDPPPVQPMSTPKTQLTEAPPPVLPPPAPFKIPASEPAVLPMPTPFKMQPSEPSAPVPPPPTPPRIQDNSLPVFTAPKMEAPQPLPPAQTPWVAPNPAPTQPAQPFRITPATPVDADPPPPMPLYPEPVQPVPVVPDNQPKRPSSFRLVNPTPSYGPSLGTERQASGPPPGTVVASSLSGLAANSAWQNYPSPAPVIPRERTINPPPRQDIPTNNTPVSAEIAGPNDMIRPGDLITYEIILRNPASAPAADVHIEVEVTQARLERASPVLPTIKNGRMAWTFATFPARSEKRLKIMMRAGGSECMASCTVWGPPVTEVGFQQKAAVPVAAGANEKLSIDVNGPSSAGLNQPAVFTIRIAHNGSQPLINPVLHVELSPGLRHPQGSEFEGPLSTLLPGKEIPVPVRTTAVQPGRHSLHCWVTADNARQVSARTHVMVGQVGLQVQQPPGYKLVAGQPNEVRFQVTNNSSDTLRRVSVTDVLPDGVEFAGYSSDDGSYHSGTREVVWLLDLAPNQSKMLSLLLQPQRAGEWSHQVLARGPHSPEISSSALLKTDSSSNLRVNVKAVGSSKVAVGKTAVYQITVSNHGTSTATNVQVRAMLSEGLTSNHAQGPNGYRDEGQQITFLPLGQLAPQAQQEFFVGVMAQSPGERGVRVNVSCDQCPQPVTRDERTLVMRD